MQMSKLEDLGITESPWMYRSDCEIRGYGDKHISLVAIATEYPNNMSKTDANGFLMAAAPDLYKALQFIHENIKIDNDEANRLMNHALLKAQLRDYGE